MRKLKLERELEVAAAKLGEGTGSRALAGQKRRTGRSLSLGLAAGLAVLALFLTGCVRGGGAETESGGTGEYSSGMKAGSGGIGEYNSGMKAGSGGRGAENSSGSAGGRGADSGRPAGEGQRQEDSGRLCVTATIFPYYDFARQIAGDRVRLKLVVPAGMDSHSFEPTPADMREIQESDILLYNGGEMEQWVDAVLEALDSSHIRAVRMMDLVDVLEEETVEGMESEHGHDHDHGTAEALQEEDHGSGADYEPGQLHAIEYDEHIWTSPVNGMAIVKEICQVFSEEDPENREFYQENARRYLKELAVLDEEFRQLMEEAREDMIILGDRFPFRYLAEAYGIQYRAAFAGCSGDTEPSARTIAYLINQVKERELPAVYYLELSSHRVAEIIGEETGAEPLLLHSCHNVTRKEFDEGITYLQLMEQNVRNLRLGLQ